MDHTETARAYYGALDGGDYDALAGLLAADFVQDRPDLALEGRDRFVRFMREERPNPDTTHELDAVVEGDDEVIARGRLLDDGAVLVRFCDVFAFDGECIRRLVTYTH